jgi:hypothetical protein
MLRDDTAAGGLGDRVAGEAQQTPAFLQRDDDVAAGAVHGGHLTPRNAYVQRASEFEPSSRQDEVAVLVGTATSEAHGRDEMTLIASRDEIRSLSGRDIAVLQPVRKFGSFEFCENVVRSAQKGHGNHQPQTGCQSRHHRGTEPYWFWALGRQNPL